MTPRLVAGAGAPAALCRAPRARAAPAAGADGLRQRHAPIRSRPGGRETCPACPNLATMARDSAALGHIRDQVGRALRGFLEQQRAVLLRVGVELLPGLEALEGAFRYAAPDELERDP